MVRGEKRFRESYGAPLAVRVKRGSPLIALRAGERPRGRTNAVIERSGWTAPSAHVGPLRRQSRVADIASVCLGTDFANSAHVFRVCQQPQGVT